MFIIKIVKYLIVFILLYIQPLTVGGFKVSFISMGILYLYILIKVYQTGVRKIDSVFKYSLLFKLKSLVSLGVFYNFTETIFDFIKEINFTLIYLYSVNILKKNKINYYLINISIFLILSFLPFVLGIIKPINKGYELSSYSSNLNTGGILGVFENSHSASVTIALSLIILTYYIFISDLLLKNSLRKGLYIIIYFFGLYILYKTYVRTGYFMYITGIGVFVIYNISFDNVPKFLFFTALVSSILFILIDSDNILKNRLFDSTEQSSGKYVDDVGSGRVTFQIAAYNIWISADILEKTLGIGIEELKNRMLPLTGLKIYTHNMFTTALVQNGIIGLFLFCIFMYSIFRSSLELKSSERQLLLSISFSYLIYQIVQGGAICPEMEIILAMVYSIKYSSKPRNIDYEFLTNPKFYQRQLTAYHQ